MRRPKSKRVERPARRLHTVLFHPPDEESWLCTARHRDLRTTMAACAADIVSIGDPGGLVALGAGFLQAATPEQAEHLANQMLGVSRKTGIGFIFGVDVGGDGSWAPIAGTPENWLFACDAGRPVVWPAKRIRTGSPADAPSESRVVDICGLRVGLVIDSEVFNAPLRRELGREKSDFILVATHLGPNARWASALEGLATVGPLVMTGETRGDPAPPWALAPHGWQSRFLGGTPSMTLVRYWSGPPLEAELEEATPV
jgi:hypothetical protein